jgi:predicted site-specific integrase-resolvase
MEIIVKLSEYAKANSITYQTAWNHFKKGLIPKSRHSVLGFMGIEDQKEKLKES